MPRFYVTIGIESLNATPRTVLVVFSHAAAAKIFDLTVLVVFTHAAASKILDLTVHTHARFLL